MYNEQHIKRALRRGEGTLYRKGTTNEYHLHTNYAQVPDDETWIIAFAVEHDSVTVITQMHEHFDYDEREIYTRVETPYDHLRPTP